MNDCHTYEINLSYHSERKGTLSSPKIPAAIQVVVPPENSNNITDWTPEHLLVAAVNSCLLSTFMAIAINLNVAFISFECNSIATIDKINDKLVFTKIILRPTVVVVTSEYEERVRRILEISKKNSAISNLLKIKIILEPKILVHNAPIVDRSSHLAEQLDGLH